MDFQCLFEDSYGKHEMPNQQAANNETKDSEINRENYVAEMVQYFYEMEHHTVLPQSTELPHYYQIKSSPPSYEYSTNANVLDLCTRKRPPSPNYQYEYHTPHSYSDNSCRSPNSNSDISDVSSTDHKDTSSPKFKCSRPFKAYPKDPLSMPMLGAASSVLYKDSSDAYVEFRDKILAKAQAAHNGTNKNMRRTQTNNIKNSDPDYWEKRKKNNEAAKRSRDARRAKEDEIAIRCAFLEQENLQLKFRVSALESERERLQKILYR